MAVHKYEIICLLEIYLGSSTPSAICLYLLQKSSLFKSLWYASFTQMHKLWFENIALYRSLSQTQVKFLTFLENFELTFDKLSENSP